MTSNMPVLIDGMVSSFTTSSWGVAIIVNRNLPLKIIKSTKDKRGCYVIVRGLLYGEEITFLNIYCPPNFSPELITKAFSDLLDTASGTVIVGGDFNCLLNPLLDRLPPKNCPPSNQSKTLSALCEELVFSDVWRIYPLQTYLTFYSPPHKCYSRIDYFFVPSVILQYISRCFISNTVFSDHAMVILVLSYSSTKKRKQVEKQERLEQEVKRATEDHVNGASPANLEKLGVIRASLDSLLLQQVNTKILFSKQRLYEQ